LFQQLLFTIDNPQAREDRKSRTRAFYEDVKREYLRLRNIKKNGVRLYSDEYILHKVAEKFYRSPKTIENIVFNRV